MVYPKIPLKGGGGGGKVEVWIRGSGFLRGSHCGFCLRKTFEGLQLIQQMKGPEVADRNVKDCRGAHVLQAAGGLTLMTH